MKKVNIVFLPSLMCDERLYTGQIEALHKITSVALNVCVFVIKDIPDIKQAATFVVDKMKGEEFYLVGTSMGGYLAMEIAKQAPNQVKKLCLVNTSWEADTEERKQSRLSIIDTVSQITDEQFIGVNDEIIKQYLHNKDERKYDLIKQMVREIGRLGFISQQNLALSRPSYVDFLCQTSIPTLVIGGEYDSITPTHIQYAMAKAIPSSRLFIIDDCAHLSPLDQPAVLGQLINDWVEKSWD